MQSGSGRTAAEASEGRLKRSVVILPGVRDGWHEATADLCGPRAPHLGADDHVARRHVGLVDALSLLQQLRPGLQQRAAEGGEERHVARQEPPAGAAAMLCRGNGAAVLCDSHTALTASKAHVLRRTGLLCGDKHALDH